MTEQLSLTTLLVIGLQKLNPYTHLIADIFIILCFILLFLALYKRGSRFAQMAPTWLTSLGLLGTFMGIGIGLSVFEGQDIQNSLPRLFNGLAMAFITGVVGIFLALLVKLINRNRQTKKPEQGITPTEIYHVLKEISEHSANQKAILSNMVEQANLYQQELHKINQLQQKGFAQEVRLLEELKQSLTGNHDNSLATQIQNLRSSAEKTAQDSNQYLVQVIESPMKYFTQTLGEQLGENFKQLNQVVSGLVTWQDHYREQMLKIHEQFTFSLSNIEQSNTSLQEMALHIQSIPHSMQQMTQMMQGLYDQLDTLTPQLAGFQHLGKEAGEILPLIETNLEELNQNMRQQIQRHLELLDTSLETQLDMAEASLEIQLDGFKTLENRLTELETQLPNRVAQLPEPSQDTIPEPEAENIEIEEEKEEALLTDEPLSEAEPTDYDSFQKKAFAFMELGRYKRAIAYFDQVIKANPEEFSLFYNKACCYALLGDVEEASVALQEAIYLNSECLDMAKTDSDFDAIRYDAGFRALMRGH
jgi:tetratricopeptide (TPR) repeat protein